MSWVKIDGHQRPWAASRLGQGIAPPRRPRSGGATAAPQTPTQRRPSGSTVIRKCRRCPCEAAPRCCVIVPRGDFKGNPPPPSSFNPRSSFLLFRGARILSSLTSFFAGIFANGSFNKILILFPYFRSNKKNNNKK